MYNCTIAEGEQFFLQMLLIAVCGPTGFDNLCTVGSICYPSFWAACVALQFLEDDGKWVSCFTEAKHYSSDHTLHCLFVSALLHEDMSNARALWEQFCKNICDNLSH